MLCKPHIVIYSSFFQMFADDYWLCRLHTKFVELTGNNWLYALNKPATFTYRGLSVTFFVPPGIKELNVIYVELSQCGNFQRPLILHIFSTWSFKYKASKLLPKCYITKLST